MPELPHSYFLSSAALAAKTFAPTGQLIITQPFSLIQRRNFKLVIPYAAVVLVSTLCAAIARNLTDSESIREGPVCVASCSLSELLDNICANRAIPAADGIPSIYSGDEL
jgi:hypothetical protein